MQWRRKRTGGESIGPARRTNEIKSWLTPKKLGDSRCLTEMTKVCTTAERHMLAVVDIGIGCRIMERTRPATKPGTRLDDRAGKTSCRQCDGCRQPGQPSTDNDDPSQIQSSDEWLGEIGRNTNSAEGQLDQASSHHYPCGGGHQAFEPARADIQAIRYDANS
jgi:hypothetical protein